MTVRYGWKVVRPDGRTRGNFRWPLVAGATAHDIDVEEPCEPHSDPCPAAPGDGLCVALTPRGIASAGFSSSTLLVVSWDDRHTAAETSDKVRVQGPVTVEAVLDWWRELREGAAAPSRTWTADLSGAYLSGAYLSGADLSRANLSGANLTDAYLSGANLNGANLSGAYLSHAYLSHAYLSGANLSGAYLSRADLTGANLNGADLSRANLNGWERGPDGYARKADT